MKSKTLTLLIFLFSSFTAAYSQIFKHSVGATILVIGSKGQIAQKDFLGMSYLKSYNFIMEAVEVTYFPRLNFELGYNSSFSIGAPISIGIGAASDINKENSGVYFSYSLPVMADLNLGLGAVEETEKRFGYFLGGGFGYGYVNLELTSGSSKISSYGPLAHGGVRFKIGNTGSITTGLFYKQGLETLKYKTFGIQVLADL